MQIIKKIFHTIIEAIFPTSIYGHELLHYSPEKAWEILPRAPRVSSEDMVSVFAYKDNRVRQLVWNIKYKKLDSSISIGGYALYRYMIDNFDLNKTIMILPIPITDQRRRERGYNQCELLLDELEQCFIRSEKKYNITFNKSLLKRIHHGTRQTLKNRTDRLEDAKEIFAIYDMPKMSSQTSVIIIDDVITTGSTMKEAVTVMRKAGFSDVRGLSLAH